MNNLTFEEGLLKERAAEPLEGHHVAVFERIGRSGERFHTLLPPGTPLKAGLLGWLRSREGYFGIAVDAAAELHLDFREHVVLSDDAAHRFDLLADLYYAAADPRLLASHRNRDPLRQLRERVRQVAARELSQMQWSTIVYDFPAAAEALAVRHLPVLQAFAAGYGIALHGVELRRLLPEVDTDPVRQGDADLAENERETRLKLARLESERRLRDAGNLHTLSGAEMDALAEEVREGQRRRAALVDVQIQGMRQVAATIDTHERYRAVFQGDVRSVAAPAPLPAPGSPEAGRDPAALPPASGGLAAVLQRIVHATGNVPGTAKRQEIRSALLHLTAEVLMEEMGDEAVRQRYAERVRERVGSLGGALPPEEMDALAGLADPNALERALRT